MIQWKCALTAPITAHPFLTSARRLAVPSAKDTLKHGMMINSHRYRLNISHAKFWGDVVKELKARIFISVGKKRVGVVKSQLTNELT